MNSFAYKTLLACLFLLLTPIVFAADCGDGIKPCACGDTLVASHTMDYDLIDCSGNGIIIGEENLNLDCDGHMIDGTGSGIGVNIHRKNNAYIKNCTVQEFNIGLDMYVSSGNIVNDSILQYNNYGARIFDHSRRNEFTNNKFIQNNLYGLEIRMDSYILWADNKIWNNSFVDNGVNAYETYYARENYWNIGRIGNYWSDFEENSGYPFKYYIPGPGGGVDEWPVGKLYPWCGDEIIEDTILEYNIVGCDDDGIIIGAHPITFDCNGHSIQGSTAEPGFRIQRRELVTIKNCNVIGFREGIFLYKGSNNYILNSSFSNNNRGIRVYDSDSNSLIGNFVNNNILQGIEIVNSANNNLTNNILYVNPYGIYLDGSENSTIWNNNLTDNSVNAYENSLSKNNNWNLSNKGNYWDDFYYNPGYPDYYKISGEGNGMDYHPLGKFLIADLQILEFEKAYPEQPQPGNNIVFYIKFYNGGNYDLYVNYTIETGDGREITTPELIEIPEKKSKLVTEYWSYSTYGNFRPKVIVDPENLITETDETNNEKATLIQIINPNPTPSNSPIFRKEFIPEATGFR